MSDEAAVEEKEAVKLEGKMAEFADWLEGISVLELSQLVKALEVRLGVTAAAPMAMAAAPAAGGGDAGGEEAAEHTAEVFEAPVEVEVVQSRQRKTLRARHLLLACGAIQSARMVLLNRSETGRSLPFIDHPPTLLPIFFPVKFGLRLPVQSFPIQLIGSLQGNTQRDMISFYYPAGMLWSDLLPDIPLPMNIARSVLAGMIGGMLVAQIWETSRLRAEMVLGDF